MKRECKECGDSFRGRSDKKFCCADCRSAYNNRINRDSTNLMRNVNNCLRRNRKILLDLCNQHKAKVARHQLIQRGFRFGYCTHVDGHSSGTPLHYCYDVGYYEKEGKVILVQAES